MPWILLHFLDYITLNIKTLGPFETSVNVYQPSNRVTAIYEQLWEIQFTINTL